MFIISITATLTPGGESLVLLDISVDYPATIIALANFCASLSGITTPVVFSLVLGTQVGSFAHWSQAYVLFSCICIAGGLVFVTMIDAVPQEFKATSQSKRSNKKEQQDGEEVEEVGAKQKELEASIDNKNNN